MLRSMNQTGVFLSCVALIGVEVLHLKWLWWTKWECRKCGCAPRECGHGAKWLMFL
jgi:hypothetical protein